MTLGRQSEHYRTRRFGHPDSSGQICVELQRPLAQVLDEEVTLMPTSGAIRRLD